MVKEDTAYALCKIIRIQLENAMRPQITDKFTMQQMIDETLEVYQSLSESDASKPLEAAVKSRSTQKEESLKIKR